MSKIGGSDAKNPLYCSFCGKSQHEMRKLIAGPRKTGARGLRSIMEAILLDFMFDLPSLEGVKEVVISEQVVDGTARPLYMYSGGVRAS